MGAKVPYSWPLKLTSGNPRCVGEESLDTETWGRKKSCGASDPSPAPLCTALDPVGEAVSTKKSVEIVLRGQNSTTGRAFTLYMVDPGSIPDIP